MILYSINIILILLYVILFQLNKKSKIFSIILFFQLYLIYIFRSYNVGWDSMNYYDVFRSSNIIEWNQIFHHWMEFGYIALNKFIRCMTDNYIILWSFIGILIFIPIFKILLKYSNNIVFSIFLYVTFGLYYNSMNQIRQAIAVSICLYAFDKAIEKKYFEACIIVAIASCFHKSTIVFIIFIIASKIIKEMNRKSIIKICISIIAVFLLSNKIIKYISRFYFTNYFTEDSLIKHTKAGDLNIFIVLLVVFLFGLYFRRSYIKKFYSKKRVYDMCLMAIAFAVGLQLLSIRLTMIARFSQYFAVYPCILIPNALSVIKDKKYKVLLAFSIILCMSIYSYIYLCVSENGYGRDGVIPYEFFWQC